MFNVIRESPLVGIVGITENVDQLHCSIPTPFNQQQLSFCAQLRVEWSMTTQHPLIRYTTGSTMFFARVKRLIVGEEGEGEPLNTTETGHQGHKGEGRLLGSSFNLASAAIGLGILSLRMLSALREYLDSNTESQKKYHKLRERFTLPSLPLKKRFGKGVGGN